MDSTRKLPPQVAERLRQFLVIAPLVIGFDISTKALAALAFEPGMGWGRPVALVYVVNDSMLQGLAGSGLVFQALGAVAAVLMVLLYLHADLRGGERVALAVLTSAVVSNGFDFAVDGAVIDFLAFGTSRYRIAVNSADLFIVGALLTGVALVLTDSTRALRRRPLSSGPGRHGTLRTQR